MGRDRIVNRAGFDTAQTHIRTGKGRHRPRETPAIAVEHRERPQIDRVGWHRPDHHVADGIEEGPAVMIDDALGVAGRARRVIQRTRVPFIRRPCPSIVRISAGDKVFVLNRADQFATDIGHIVYVDHADIGAELGEGALDRVREFPIGQ